MYKSWGHRQMHLALKTGRTHRNKHLSMTNWLFWVFCCSISNREFSSYLCEECDEDVDCDFIESVSCFGRKVFFSKY
ncbi:mCG146984 [Mus musculus]|nr:mCG146984 [Mus musculus]